MAMSILSASYFNVHSTTAVEVINPSANIYLFKGIKQKKKGGCMITTSSMAEANGSNHNGSGSQFGFNLTSMNFKTEEDLLSGIKRGTEAGMLSSKVSEGMEELYLTYRNAVSKSGHPKAPEIALYNTALAFQCIFMDMKNPFEFAPYHTAIREPFDYYMFGQNYIRPLIDFRNSYVGNISVFHEIEEKLKKGENIILISNHQTEADPAVIALLLDSTNPYLSENMTYVAGDRVVIDPLCKPFSMGRNLICVHSKKHMDDDPELFYFKRYANRRSLKAMSSLLKKGSQIIWIAPSGGRDRRNPKTQECCPAEFDASAVDSMRRLLEKAGVPGHIYPMALLCYDIMPPPEKVEKIVGEKRMMDFHGVGLSIGRRTDFSDVVDPREPIEVRWDGCRELAKMAKVELYTKALYKSVSNQYKVLKSAIYQNKGLQASTAEVSLSQPFNTINSLG